MSPERRFQPRDLRNIAAEIDGEEWLPVHVSAATLADLDSLCTTCESSDHPLRRCMNDNVRRNSVKGAIMRVLLPPQVINDIHRIPSLRSEQASIVDGGIDAEHRDWNREKSISNEITAIRDSVRQAYAVDVELNVDHVIEAFRSLGYDGRWR